MPSVVGSVPLPTGQDIQGGVEKVIGQPLYQPQTEAGRIADRVVQGASIPGARLAGAIGGATGEAGRVIAGKPGDIVGSLIGGGLVSLGQSLVGTPERVLQNALENVSDSQLAQADDLVKQSIARGTPITGAEAIAQVTGGNVRLQDLQRVLERTAGGAGSFEPIMQNRPTANAAAMGAETDKIAPAITQPSEIAPRVQAAAEQTVESTRKSINAQTKPLYEASTVDQWGRSAEWLTSAQFAQLQKNPIFARALQQVRSDPVYADLANMPDRSVAVIDAVKKQLGEDADVAGRQGANLHQAKFAAGKSDVEQAARDASPAYAEALDTQAKLREQVLDPLKRSAAGQLAATEKFPQQAAVLFNPRPLEGSENEISSAVKSVVAKDPEAAQQLVRAYLKQRFDELTQGLATGPNQFGGAAFAADVAGNAQQAKNLSAALKALPNGDEIASSFGNLLSILKAQGMRARPGSATAFNAETQGALAKGGNVAEILQTVTSPRSLTNLGKEYGARILYERNSARLAEILTSPDSVKQMRQLAKLDPQSAGAKALYRSLVPVLQSANQQQ